MDCTRCREIVSADLDREATAEERRAADQHLTGCAACCGWTDRVVAVTRRARIHAVEVGPDLVGLVMPAAEHAQGRIPACGCPANCGCGCRQGHTCSCVDDSA